VDELTHGGEAGGGVELGAGGGVGTAVGWQLHFERGLLGGGGDGRESEESEDAGWRGQGFLR
jgi:hypothetical protein